MEGLGRSGGAVEEDANEHVIPDYVLDLPPGFRFHPTDEEVITHYLTPKVLDPRFASAAVSEVDLNKCEPWDMPCRAKIGEKDWYFFCQKDRKYPTGTRTNRATYAGYWKATGKDKGIYKGSGRDLVGMKKTLVFYTGRAPKGSKTNWVMHEFRLEGLFPYRHINKDEWVVCRVFNKTVGGMNNNNNEARPPISFQPEVRDSAVSFIDELLENSSPPPPPLPPLADPSNIASSSYSKCECDDLAEKNHPDHFGNSDYSLRGQIGSTSTEGFEFQAHPGFLLGGSHAGRCDDEGDYYGYLEGSVVDVISHYDELFESIRRS